MIDAKLNLTRKLRAKNFDQIIGQTLSIRMLKNSLYLGYYFPVYLFSGQRGCGKTTTARLFSAALNCKNLELFQKNPKKYQLPCGVCESCSAMFSGTHPDFIEMDAASHTGVDNVRQIIDAASLLPVMGIKKIYLIDEAHMLSKAAFNALLKILEEPPANVLFILATTDPQKIIDTVKSRCFQLLFRAVANPDLLSHLQQVCVAEGISYESEGLLLIIHETRGSVRDALNVVEQVRFSTGSVTAQAVLKVLDHLDTGSFIHIIDLILRNKAQDLLLFLKKSTIEQFSAEYIWRRFVELIRTLLWLKHGVKPYQHEDCGQVDRLLILCSVERLNRILQHIYDNEEVFAKTTAQHLFLEMFFLQLCHKSDGHTEGSSAPPHSAIAPSRGQISADGDEQDDDGHSDDADEYGATLGGGSSVEKNVKNTSEHHRVGITRNAVSTRVHTSVSDSTQGEDFSSSNSRKMGEIAREIGSVKATNVVARSNERAEQAVVADAHNNVSVGRVDTIVVALENEEDTLMVRWNRLVEIHEVQQEPLLHSVLSQGVCLEIVPDGVVVKFAKELSFFESVIREARAIWYPHFQRIFSADAQLIMRFTGESKGTSLLSQKNNASQKEGMAGSEDKSQRTTEVSSRLGQTGAYIGEKKASQPRAGLSNGGHSSVEAGEFNKGEQKKTEYKKVEQNRDYVQHGYQREQKTRFVAMDSLCEQSSAIDISDASVWKTTHVVLYHFPGSVREVQQ